MTATLDMHAVAEICGYSYERFRKVWTRLPGFPAPIKRPGVARRGAYAWSTEAVRAWLAARERALGVGELRPANDSHAPRAANAAALARQRASMLRLVGRAS